MTERMKWKCSVCGSTELQAPLPGAPFFNEARYHRCAACGSVLLLPLPETEENLAFESSEAAEDLAAADDERTALLRRRLDVAGSPGQGGGRLLEIGCGAGRLIGLARDAGWEVAGVEMSRRLAEKAREHNPGAPIRVGDFMQMELAPLGTFDVIIALDVIEHVLSPEDFLRRVFALLNPGGRLVLHTPNARGLRARMHGGRWNMLIPEYHFCLFSPGGLRGLLRRCGFENLKVITTSGTGLEKGAAAVLAGIKEAALRSAGLGNALLVSAEKPRQDAAVL